MNISRGNIFGQKVVTVALLSAKCKWMVIKRSIDELITYDDERLKASGKRRHDLTCFKLQDPNQKISRENQTHIPIYTTSETLTLVGFYRIPGIFANND